HERGPAEGVGRVRAAEEAAGDDDAVVEVLEKRRRDLRRRVRGDLAKSDVSAVRRRSPHSSRVAFRQIAPHASLMTLRQIAPHPSLMALRQIVYFSVVTRHARVHTHVGVHMRPSLVRPITFTLPLFLLFAGVSSSRAQDRRLQPADLFQLEYAADPQISPDGQWVAYVRQWSDNMTDRRYSNIWLVKADGSLHRPLTSGKFEETS